MKQEHKRVTIKDVAKLADVSIATVSKVMNGKDEHVGDKTREHVRSSANRLGYVPNDMAKRLKESKSKTIGLVLPEFSNAYPEIILGADDEASSRGYNLFLCNTNNSTPQEEKRIRMLGSKMVDGIIYVSANFELSQKIISSLNIPCVVINRKIQTDENVGFVGIDDFAAMKEVGAYLVKNGCKRIGCVTADITKYPHDERLLGLRAGLGECGVTLDKSLLYSGSLSADTGFIGATVLLNRERNLDCIVCGSDFIAIGVMNVCHKIGKMIPDEIRIIGFDDNYISKYLTPELTTIKQNTYEMGEMAARMLINYMEYGNPLDTITLKHEIVQRETV